MYASTWLCTKTSAISSDGTKSNNVENVRGSVVPDGVVTDEKVSEIEKKKSLGTPEELEL